MRVETLGKACISFDSIHDLHEGSLRKNIWLELNPVLLVRLWALFTDFRKE